MRYVALALLVAAITQELRKPASERTWHGRVIGFVPYDLRLPTLSRFTGAIWNPNSPSILVGTPFGVGWTLNLRALQNFLGKASRGT
jgi:hypothetical protein